MDESGTPAHFQRAAWASRWRPRRLGTHPEPSRSPPASSAPALTGKMSRNQPTGMTILRRIAVGASATPLLPYVGTVARRGVVTDDELRAVIRSELAEHVPPRLLRRGAAARALGVSERTVDTLIRSGELPSVKIGKRRLIPVQALDEYVADLEQGAA